MPPHLYDYLLPGNQLLQKTHPSSVAMLSASTAPLVQARLGPQNVLPSPQPVTQAAPRGTGKRTHSQANGSNLDPKSIPWNNGQYDGRPVTMNANQVRSRIHRVIDNAEMTVKEFCQVINVTPTAYYRFMGQTGPTKGMESSVFENAWAYFVCREELGVKMPTKKRKTAADAGSGADSNAADATRPSTNFDVSDIHLDGEEQDAVPVFDTCDTVRRKINEFLKRPDVTKKAFLETLLAQFRGPRRPPQISATSLNTFRDKSGADNGNTSPVFYAAYCFFEKLRIKENKPKSKDRLKMEEIWGSRSEDRPNGGMDITYNARGHGVFLRAGETASVDKWGRLLTH